MVLIMHSKNYDFGAHTVDLIGTLGKNIGLWQHGREEGKQTSKHTCSRKENLGRGTFARSFAQGHSEEVTLPLRTEVEVTSAEQVVESSRQWQ
jgi:hypothetical protein